MRKGEKMMSFVKFEKALESDYRKALDEIKRPDEIGKVFVDFAIKLLKNVDGKIDEKLKDEIKFLPENDPPFKISDSLKQKLGELIDKSDLNAILDRMARSAQHRYVKLKKDDERTDLFRLGENAKAH